MKRLFSWILIAVLLCAIPAHAQTPALSENMFKYTKATLTALAGGAYEKIVANLPFSGGCPSAKEWKSLAEGSFTALTGSAPQTQYAAAWWNGRMWKIAVPVSEPDHEAVEALVLFSEDGSSFTGYSCAEWGSVERELQKADYVAWNEEYFSSTSVFVESDVN